MEQALKHFIEEYTVWLNATKKDYDLTKNAYIAAQKSPLTNEIKDELNSMVRHLFQMNYMLMESHIAIFNLYVWYSDEEKQLIDEYKPTCEKVSKLIKAVDNFTKSVEAKDEVTPL